MATNQSSKTVFLALSVNFFIAIVKTIISVITSSSAMFSEAIHSYVDSANQFILWFGMKQSKKANKKIYPKKGDLIIFPGHVQHEVPILETEEERIMIAGNLYHSWTETKETKINSYFNKHVR